MAIRARTTSSSSRSTVLRLTVALAAAALAATLAAPQPAFAEPSIKQLEKKVDKASAELEIIVEDYNELNQELKDLEKQHAETGRELKPLRSRAEQTATEVGDIAASLYRAGPAVTVTPIISGSPDTLIERLSLLEFMSLEQDDLVDELAATTKILESEELEIDDLERERGKLKAKKSKKQRAITRDRDRLRDLRDIAMGQGYRDNPGLKAPPIPGGDAGAAATAVRFVHGALGSPYQWGGVGPHGYDCSGLTSAAWGSAGVSLPHNAAAQYRSIPHVGRGELQPGDLVFYYGDIHHVGMYVGQGKIIHAPSEGQNVRVSGIDELPVSGYGRPA